MQEIRTNVFDREDTFFGVCEALGQDFGFHPNLLRVALAVALFFNPVAVLVLYAAAGAIVALSRWMAPPPAAAMAAVGEPVHASISEAPAGDNDSAAEMLVAA